MKLGSVCQADTEDGRTKCRSVNRHRLHLVDLLLLRARLPEIWG